MFKPLDPILHSQLRLAIIAILAGVETADFVYLKDKTNASAGNLSLQLSKLQEVGYISIEKGFNGKYPKTTCALTEIGRLAYGQYVEALNTYIAPASPPLNP